MTEIEKLMTQIGEFVSCEMPGVKDIAYAREKNYEITTFKITMINGNCYELKIKSV
ncbi:MAG: hypothetical protein FWE22_00535 [Firmicutes bacterium]|nr:hypothetical protein [Bacillota bacterium]